MKNSRRNRANAERQIAKAAAHAQPKARMSVNTYLEGDYKERLAAQWNKLFKGDA